jgi:hypothetical protein
MPCNAELAQLRPQVAGKVLLRSISSRAAKSCRRRKAAHAVAQHVGGLAEAEIKAPDIVDAHYAGLGWDWPAIERSIVGLMHVLRRAGNIAAGRAIWEVPQHLREYAISADAVDPERIVELIIIGGGIGGLTLALAAHAAKAAARIRVFEAAPDIRPLGVGINLGPHAVKELSQLGLQDALAAVACQPQDYAFFTSHGQLVYREPWGLAAGHQWPHFSIHRADLHQVLLDAVRQRLGRKTSSPATAASASSKAMRASPRASPPRTAPRWNRSRPTCWWHAMASTPRCAAALSGRGPFDPIAASICGAG